MCAHTHTYAHTRARPVAKERRLCNPSVRASPHPNESSGLTVYFQPRSGAQPVDHLLNECNLLHPVLCEERRREQSEKRLLRAFFIFIQLAFLGKVKA